jgi:hypothetical protein
MSAIFLFAAAAVFPNPTYHSLWRCRNELRYGYIEDCLVVLYPQLQNSCSDYKSLPGEKPSTTAVWMLSSLFAPYSGIFGVCLLIARARIKGETDLQHVLRAEARA